MHTQEAFNSGNKEKYRKLRNVCNRKAPLLKPHFYQRSVDNACDDNSNIAHLFLSLDLRKNLTLLTMFARLTCLVYYIGC